MKITNHHELRKKTTIDCSHPKITDQSFKNACDINVIMANYAKTGMLSHVVSSEPKFIDNTDIPSLEHAFTIVRTAEDAFFTLPPDIRRLMDNNPSNLENFVSNPSNAYILEQHGLILKTKTTETTPMEAITQPKELI